MGADIEEATTIMLVIVLAFAVITIWLRLKNHRAKKKDSNK